MNWTDERVTELRGHFEAGLTAGQIAIAMGFGTRGPIVGKLHRLGLERGIRPKPAPMPRAPRQVLPRTAPVVAPLVPDAAPPRAAEPSSRHRCDILGLRNETCRYPVTDEPPHMFCGTPEADAAHGYPYCPHHARIAYSGRSLRLTDDEHARRSAHARKNSRPATVACNPGADFAPGARRWGAAG